MPEGVIAIRCVVTEHVSLAYHENAVPVIRETVVANASDEDFLDVCLTVEG